MRTTWFRAIRYPDQYGGNVPLVENVYELYLSQQILFPQSTIKLFMDSCFYYLECDYRTVLLLFLIHHKFYRCAKPEGKLTIVVDSDIILH